MFSFNIMATMLPIFDYCCIVWMDCTKQLSGKMERLQNEALRNILCKDRRTCSQVLPDNLGLCAIEDVFCVLSGLTFKIVKKISCPRQLLGKLTKRINQYGRFLKDSTTLHIPKTKSSNDF